MRRWEYVTDENGEQRPTMIHGRKGHDEVATLEDGPRMAKLIARLLTEINKPTPIYEVERGKE
jgi:hypothetical protein